MNSQSCPQDGVPENVRRAVTGKDGGTVEAVQALREAGHQVCGTSGQGTR